MIKKKSRKRLRIRRNSGSRYVIDVRYSSKQLKRAGICVPPNQGVSVPLGTSQLFFFNGGSFTFAHVRVIAVRRQQHVIISHG